MCKKRLEMWHLRALYLNIACTKEEQAGQEAAWGIDSVKRTCFFFSFLDVNGEGLAD